MKEMHIDGIAVDSGRRYSSPTMGGGRGGVRGGAEKRRPLSPLLSPSLSPT